MFSVAGSELLRDGEPFFAVGCNYHPSTSGCDYWRCWDREQVGQDLRAIATQGFNTVRFFLFWRDFEPNPGEISQVALEHLDDFVTLAERAELACVPSLMTLWMNGQLLDLPWRSGRDLWTNDTMVEHELAYVRTIAARLAKISNLLAYDLGDEILHVDREVAGTLDSEAIAAWYAKLAEAIRDEHHEALVLQANELSALGGQHAFGPRSAGPLDLDAIHGFPLWTPFQIESIASYKASNLASFLVRRIDRGRPVLIDEIGCYGCSPEVATGYLEASLASLAASGACGALVWCWQDIAATNAPYEMRPGERYVGLLDLTGRPKAPLGAVRRFARRVAAFGSGFKREPASVGLYVPAVADHRDDSYLGEIDTSVEAAFYAALLCRRAHLPFKFVTEADSSCRLLVCPSIHHVTLADQDRWQAYVENGGVLFFTPGSYLHGFGGEDVFGVALADYRLAAGEATESTFNWAKRVWQVGWPSSGVAIQVPRLRSINAEVLASFADGSPALTRRRHGSGAAYYLNAPLEVFLNHPGRLDSAPWHELYRVLAALAGIELELDVDQPCIEVSVWSHGSERLAWLINHEDRPVVGTVARSDGNDHSLEFAAKAVALEEWSVASPSRRRPVRIGSV